MTARTQLAFRRPQPARITVERGPRRVVVGWTARRAARSGAMWGLVFGAYSAASALGYASLYNTPASRENLAHSFGSSVGITAMIGPARDLDTAAGFTAWRSLGMLTLIGAVWGLLTAAKLLRGEEETGRWDLMLAGQTTRRGATAQALVGLGAGLVALFAANAVLTVATGRSSQVDIPTVSALYFSLTVVAGAAEFLAVGALTSQLAATRRRAAGLAGALFAAAYALRMVADSDPRLHWMVWFSPFGWVEETRPLSGSRPLALIPIAVLIAVLVGVTLHLAGVRDAGGATLADHDTAAPRRALLGSPIRLAVRLARPAPPAWLAATTAFALLIGLVAESATQAVTGSHGVQKFLAAVGGRATVVDVYLGLTFLIIAIMVTMIAAGQVATLRAEESEGRLDTLLARPVGRVSWLAGRLAVDVAVLTAAGALAGIGAWGGAVSQHTGVRFASLLAAGVNVVPPALFILGLGVLVLGARLRSAAFVVYGYLAWSILLEFIGGLINASHWLMDTSVLFHMLPAPATSPNWSGAAVLTVLAAACAGLGAVLFDRRDTTGS